MNWNVVQKDCFVYIHMSLRPRSQKGLVWSKYDSFYYIFWPVHNFANKFGLLVNHQQPMCDIVCPCGKKIWLLLSRSGSQWMFKLSMNVCSDNILWTAEPLIYPNLVWWCIVMGHSVLQKDWLWSRSQWELIWSDMTVCTISAELLILLHPNLIG